MPDVNRRQFLAGSAVLGVFASRADSLSAQTRLPTVGLLGAASPDTFRTALTGFLAGLVEAGFIEGRSVNVQYRWAHGQFEVLPALAQELVAHPVDVIATIGGNVTALAARRATATVPIVFLTADDPVATGLVASLSRPGGNMTGVTWLAAALTAKNLELIRDTLPEATIVGALFNPSRPTAQAQLAGAEVAAAALGLRLKAFYAATPEDIDLAFVAAEADGLRAFLVTVDGFFIFHRARIISAAARYRIPTVYFQREFVELGGLMSYGAREHDAAKVCGDYAGRILRGARAADLPVQQSTRVDLAINLRTARNLGLVIPSATLARADEVSD